MKKQAANNRLCGAERIRGELLTLGIQRSQANDLTKPPGLAPFPACGQAWKTFLRNHVAEVWACDALTGDRSLLSPAFCFLPHRTEVAKGDPYEYIHQASTDFLGGAYRCERRLRMGKRQISAPG